MNYPVWQLGFPGGLLIALVAVLHVFVSHFAIGGGAFLVVTEHRARARKDAALLAYVRRYSSFFALLTLVFGALSGVGIWFTIGLVAPEATSTLIHTFVWGWAIEWVFFFVEITSAIIYAKSWERLSGRAHMIVGWIYFGAAWLSLVVINGIIAFMLTPGRWLQTHNFWDGFFNPTFWPSLLTRSAMCAVLAGVWGFVTVGQNERRQQILRWSGLWVLCGVPAFALSLWWYVARVPEIGRAMALRFSAPAQILRGGIACMAFVVLLTLVFALWRPGWMRTPVMALLVLCALAAMGAGEYLREFARKPWAVSGYIYANDIPVARVEAISASGVRQSANFLPGDDHSGVQYGRDLFVLECSACHSVRGYRGIASRVVGWDVDFAADMLSHIHMMRAPMPRFAGNAEDRAALGAYLASLNPPLNFGAITVANRLQVGRQVFDVRCGHCHSINGGYRPLRGAFEKSTPDQVMGMFPVLDTMSENMPKFTAPEDQVQALAEYIAHEANLPLQPTEKSDDVRPPGVK